MSDAPQLNLLLWPDRMAVCMLPPDSVHPDWADGGEFYALTRTPDELSVVCPQRCVPAEVMAERDWRVLQVEGPLDFSLVGILASIAGTLAEEDISIFAISTYQTDYILVKEDLLPQAVVALGQAGYTVKNNVSLPT